MHAGNTEKSICHMRLCVYVLVYVINQVSRGAAYRLVRGFSLASLVCPVAGCLPVFPFISNTRRTLKYVYVY